MGAMSRKEEIINAARHLFLTKKYDKATMQDVMDRLDIAKGTIYHYFKSKEDLLEAVVEDIVNKNVERMQGLVLTGNALEKMERLVEASRLDQENILEALHMKGNEALHTRLLASTILKMAPLYAQIIQEGCEEGIFQTDAPLECAEIILSAVQFLTDEGIYPWTEGDLARRAKSFPKIIEQLLKAPEGS